MYFAFTEEEKSAEAFLGSDHRPISCCIPSYKLREVFNIPHLMSEYDCFQLLRSCLFYRLTEFKLIFRGVSVFCLVLPDSLIKYLFARQ